MNGHPDKLRFFISESTPEINKFKGPDLITLQTGRFASYLEREIPLYGTGLSIFLNYGGIPEGFILIGASFDTMFNSLILGQDKEFLPIAKHKYPIFAECLKVFEEMRTSLPKKNQIWLGIDRDPHDGAEITTICSVVSVDRGIVNDAEALLSKICKDDIRTLSQCIIEKSFQILEETSKPIRPIADTLNYKRDEFLTDIRDPKKVCGEIIKALMKQYGWPLVDSEIDRFLEQQEEEIVAHFGPYVYEILIKVTHNKEVVMTIMEQLRLLKELAKRGD